MGDFKLLRCVSRDQDRHPDTLECLHKIQNSDLEKFSGGAQFDNVQGLAAFLEESDEAGLQRFHVEALLLSSTGKNGSSVTEDWARTPESAIIIDEALAKGPFDSEVTLLLSDEWKITNKGVSWTLDRQSRHLLGGRIITTNSRYFAPAGSVKYLDVSSARRMPTGYQMSVSEDETLAALSGFQEFCTRADFTIRHHNESSRYSSMERAERILLTTSGVTVRTLTQSGTTYMLKGSANLRPFREITGPSKVEQLWSLSKFEYGTWAAAIHLALVSGTPSDAWNQKRWSWDSLPRLF